MPKAFTNARLLLSVYNLCIMHNSMAHVDASKRVINFSFKGVYLISYSLGVLLS